MAATSTKTGKPIEAKQGPILTAFVRVHNLGLTVFSAWVFQGMLRVLLEAYQKGEIFGPNLFTGFGLDYWAWVFYYSKYYELVDTALLIITGKDVTVLQGFHHSGAILTMWLLCVYRVNAVWVFCLFNSFVHSWMYIYYFITTFRHTDGTPNPLPVRLAFKLKPYLTKMQIIQFIVGGSIGFIYYATKTIPFAEKTVMVIVQGYLIALIVLFAQFYKKSYNKKSYNKDDKSTK